GEGVKRDAARGIKWYNYAAEHGHAQAMNSLGYIYANGDGVGANMREALNWWKQSARRGLREAQDELKQRGISW
ncbi:sel1 repeat family protein, partial [Candidatus Sumerlaeota bacterium]|nr:sel1 repeat family protein [Candidatus Sumerlaeota bacterium]